MTYREIFVLPEGQRFRVATVPSARDIPDRFYDKHEVAMAHARLLRLEHGFKIVEAPGAARFRRAKP